MITDTIFYYRCCRDGDGVAAVVDITFIKQDSHGLDLGYWSSLDNRPSALALVSTIFL